ncbi:hypothetical protein [Singulisphaera acidiphila]|uniref:Uncharacterized protein n=1 Tax=Singulisphaera acidiphila (strain ATCC BAA-1392 / DSM 18658 / VKM B-2454 / MOB10) TaxID=886293 RepID=L0DBU6_SINAD|nr:hypothetical protein [Singulisphaera acidiphila]AGA26839.1 hypothetical protein Sinac_2532 [Singulisphaera acidiphila DSM 18658]
MLTHQNRLIVEDALCASRSVHTLRVHHCEFPEIRAECSTVAEGVTHLIVQLKCARENIQSKWRCDLIDRAIDDANELLQAMAEAELNKDNAPCECTVHVPDQIETTLPERRSSL